MDAAQQHLEAQAATRSTRTALPFAHDNDDWLRSKVLASIPEATRHSYTSALKDLTPHVIGDAPDDQSVLDRIRELDEQGRSVSAMRLALASANFYRKYAGLGPLGPPCEHFTVAVYFSRFRLTCPTRQGSPFPTSLRSQRGRLAGARMVWRGSFEAWGG